MVNAMEMAAYFQELPVVKEVIYPWWETHPQYELAKKQMTGGQRADERGVLIFPGEQIKKNCEGSWEIFFPQRPQLGEL